MSESTSSVYSLPEGLTDALQVEFSATGQTQRFACRPLAARSAESHTAYGRFAGQISLSNTPDFSAAMHDLISENIDKIILDFSDVTLTKSAAGALICFAAAMHGRNKRLYLFKCQPQVLALLKELGLLPFFSFQETVEDILASLVV